MYLSLQEPRLPGGATLLFGWSAGTCALGAEMGFEVYSQAMGSKNREWFEVFL